MRAPLLPRPRDGNPALSFGQQRLWFLDQLEPGRPIFNLPRAICLKGALDVQALTASINEIVQRHEVLRTTFVAVDGKPRQVIAQALTLMLPTVDLQELPESERESEALRLTAAETRRPFDLAQGPLVRATLLRVAADEHILLLTMHHIVSDGWSLGIFFQELASLYEAFCAGRPSPLPELPIQYADYAVWQKERLQGEVLEKQLSYWREQLAGAPAALELPTDRPRPATQSFRGARQHGRLSRNLTEQLKALAQREGVTLYMLLLAAFQVLLSRYSGQEDIVVGSPVAGRNRAAIEGVIGFFVNMLAMRTSLSGNPTFRETLKQVRDVSLGAYEHQDLPFEKLVEELQPERSLGHSPVFQVVFDLNNTPEIKTQLLDLKVNSLNIDKVTSRFDLILFISEEAEGFSCWLEYSADLFDAATVRRMITHYQTLLESVVANPEEQVWKLELLTGEELEQLLVEWNNTEREYPREQTIHRLFEAQVERTPDAVAAVFNDLQLTYRQLNERANQLAHYLQKLGVGPEVLVAISVDRSLEMVIGLLGILKAGGAYVPLDPSYPLERLSFIIEDARSPVLLTQERLVENLPSQAARIVCLDRDWEGINRESTENVNSAVESYNLAYVIYTSGSTGRPKGVAIEHHSTVALLEWTKAVFAAEDLEGVLASTSICFDLSVFELFVTLTRGGKVILALDALQLIEFAAAQEVRLINTVPSAISELVRVGGIPSSVRTVNLAGEPLAQALVEQLYEQEGVERVFDLYGPSEDTTYSTYALRRRGGVETIGRPISNTQVYILDEQQRVVPVGVPGEICIGGDGLARGYLNRPELTAEHFIPTPFSKKPGARIYRTGDRARYLHNGDIAFSGRIDHQVKVRGYRIELGEIETVLSEHPWVHECAVIAREDQPGDKHLVAYFVKVGEVIPSNSELRSYLKEKLPEYMVPAAFVVLEKLPLTPNGKVDRRVLPEPERARLESEGKYQAPRNPVEEMLAVIWAKALRKEQVGVHDNFFELGGHSLLATQIIARVRDTFQVELPLRMLFERPTVAGLAETIERAQRNGPTRRAPAIALLSRH